MRPHPTPSSSSRTAAQSPAEKCRSASGSSRRSSCARRSSSVSTRRLPASATEAASSRSTARRRRRSVSSASVWRDDEQRLRPVDGVHLERREPRLLLAPEAKLDLAEPVDEARDQRLLQAPAPAGGRAAEALELALQAGAELAHLARLAPQRLERVARRRRRQRPGAGLGRGPHGAHPGRPAVDGRLRKRRVQRGRLALLEVGRRRAPALRHLEQRAARLETLDDVAQLAEPPLVVDDAARRVGHPRRPARRLAPPPRRSRARAAATAR